MANKGFERFLSCGGPSRGLPAGKGLPPVPQERQQGHAGTPSSGRGSRAVRKRLEMSIKNMHVFTLTATCHLYSVFLRVSRRVLRVRGAVPCGGGEGRLFFVARSEIATSEEVPLPVQQLTTGAGGWSQTIIWCQFMPSREKKTTNLSGRL